jgi:hypothetical protein
MGQTTLPPWLEIVGFIFSIISTFIGIALSIYLIQKAKLENQKIRLETKKLELEILEKEAKLRGKRLASKTTSNNKVKSAFEKFLLDVQNVEDSLTIFLMKLMSPFKTYQQQNSIAIINRQRIAGTLIEFVLLLLLTYTDINLMVNNLALFYPTAIPPSPFLVNSTIPLSISYAGIILALGLKISDLRGLTSFTSAADLRQENKPFFLSIASATLIISVVLPILSAVNRLHLIQNSSLFVVLVSSLAESLFIIPLLTTTSLLYSGMIGILLILALPIILLRFPITIFRKIISRIIFYVSD